ncbi:hypothetical protein GCM10025770_37810 [Viridibacterium curvum]|uniref:Uncharacterized protein n=2 Tax=Viridibacterium curvum TaxID=1101404 RepID=A0ABP9R6V2_9RHOO
MNAIASRVVSAQVIETARAITLFGFDAEDRCVLACQGLIEEAPASLQRYVASVIEGWCDEGCETDPTRAAALYDLLTGSEDSWEVIAEHDGEKLFLFEEDMSRASRRFAGVGYVLGLLHLKPEGNWFEQLGEGSIWQYTFRDPIAAEEWRDELVQDCEIHSVANLLEKGCVLRGE